NLSTTEQTFNLSDMNENDLKVEVSRYSGYADKYYCNDIILDTDELISIWKGSKGTVKIKITQDSLGVDSSYYKINIIIQDIELKNESEDKINIRYLEFNDVFVGWFPG